MSRICCAAAWRRFTDGVEAPRGLAARAARARSRRRAIRAAAAGTACAAVTAVAVITATGGPQAAPAHRRCRRGRPRTYEAGSARGRRRGLHLVMRARTTSSDWGPSVVWGYGAANRFEEFTGKGCQHALPSGDCTHQGGSERYLAQGTARIGSKLTPVYVAYYNREWSVLPGPRGQPASACSATGAEEMSGPPPTPGEWPAFHPGHAWLRGRHRDRGMSGSAAWSSRRSLGSPERSRWGRVRPGLSGRRTPGSGGRCT